MGLHNWKAVRVHNTNHMLAMHMQTEIQIKKTGARTGQWEDRRHFQTAHGTKTNQENDPEDDAAICNILSLLYWLLRLAAFHR